VHEPKPRIDDFQDMFENAPCGYMMLQTNGRIARVNNTLLGWIGHAPEDMVGKRFSDFVKMAERIYFETHIAPWMQGFFNEFAIEMVTADLLRS
jgi:phosphoserine phosphatase RsbU/P